MVDIVLLLALGAFVIAGVVWALARVIAPLLGLGLDREVNPIKFSTAFVAVGVIVTLLAGLALFAILACMLAA